MKTRNRLAAVLREAGLERMADAALLGRYDDFASESATPIVDLVAALRKAGREDLAQRAIDGEFDATREEGEEWAASPEGQAALRRLQP